MHSPVYQNNSTPSLQPHLNIQEIPKNALASKPVDVNCGWNPIKNPLEHDHDSWGNVSKIPNPISRSRKRYIRFKLLNIEAYYFCQI